MDAEAPELRALASHYAARGGTLWVAGPVDGMVATAPLADGAWEICRVYVHPRLHGAGLGRALLQVGERHAAASGASELVLWSDTRFTRAHRFYERHSYVRAGKSRALADIGNTLEFRYAKPLHGVRELDAAGAQSVEEVLASWADQTMLEWQDVTRRVALGRSRLFAGWSDGRLAGAARVGSDEGGTQVLNHPEHCDHSLDTALRDAAGRAAKEIP